MKLVEQMVDTFVFMRVSSSNRSDFTDVFMRRPVLIWLMLDPRDYCTQEAVTYWSGVLGLLKGRLAKMLSDFEQLLDWFSYAHYLHEQHPPPFLINLLSPH